MSVYTSASTDPAVLRAVVDGHPVGINGRCLTCWAETCVQRADALRALAVLNVLPCRRPGATRPELIGAKRVTT